MNNQYYLGYTDKKESFVQLKTFRSFCDCGTKSCFKLMINWLSNFLCKAMHKGVTTSPLGINYLVKIILWYRTAYTTDEQTKFHKLFSYDWGSGEAVSNLRDEIQVRYDANGAHL